jgi:hypothetical protein
MAVKRLRRKDFSMVMRRKMSPSCRPMSARGHFWGTDWPHPNHQGPIPDDGVLVDILAEIAPTDSARQALLVDNPQRFYSFAPARRLVGTWS